MNAPIRASSVTRALTAAGMSTVRGDTWTCGMTSRNIPGRSAEVVVGYNPGPRRRDAAVAAEVIARMDEAAAILTAKGYTVTRRGVGAAATLLVTRPAA